MAKLPVALEKGVKVSSEDGITRFTPDGATKVILYLHGGGYVFGSAMADGALASSLASRAHRIVVAPDYRLAPENPCPAALDDARKAYQNLLDRGVAPEDIVIAGLSSGGGLALALAARLRDEGAPMPDALVLLSPLLDATATRPSWVENARYDWGDRETVIGWARLYASDLPLDDPRVSPGRGDLRGLPRTLVVAGELELGRDDATVLVDQGATLLVGPAMVHAYITFKGVPAANEALEDVARFAGNE